MLGSRFGRRVLAFFLLAAFAPLCAYALLSLASVRAQLEADARSRLEREARYLGIALLGRLIALEGELELALEGGARAVDGAPAGGLLALERRPAPSPPEPGRRPAPPTRLVYERCGDEPCAYLVRAAAAPGEAWFARVDREALFRDLLDDPTLGVRVRFPGELGAWVPQMPPEGEELLAGSFELFLATRFGAPSLELEVSWPARLALAPVRRFEVAFLLTTLGALLFVALLSLVLIRHTLTPITALRDATRRIARREVGARVEVARRDELGELAESFNAMAARVEQHHHTLLTLSELGVTAIARGVEAFLDDASDAIADRLDADLGALFERDESGAWRLRVSRGLAPEAERALLAWLSREPDANASRDDPPRVLPAGDTPLGGSGSVVFLAVPRGAGCVLVVRSRRERLRGAELDFLRALASLLGTVLEREDARRALELQRAELVQAQKMEALGRLASGIVHDVNNVLTVIRASTELAEAEAVAGRDPRADLGRIAAAVDRAEALSRRILAFGRRSTEASASCDAGACLRELHELLVRTLEADVQLALDVAEGLPEAAIGASELEQVVMNLVVNARDAMPDGGIIAVTLDAVERPAGPAELRLRVADTGAGMDEATRERIFEPFFTTRRPGKGTGLGLATVFGLVRGAGGSISVESEPGKGSTFEIRIPARAPA